MEKKIRIMNAKIASYEVTAEVPVMEQTTIPRGLLEKETAEGMAFDLLAHSNIDTDKKDYARIAAAFKFIKTVGGDITGILLYNNAGDKHLQILIEFLSFDQLKNFSDGFSAAVNG